MGRAGGVLDGWEWLGGLRPFCCEALDVAGWKVLGERPLSREGERGFVGEHGLCGGEAGVDVLGSSEGDFVNAMEEGMGEGSLMGRGL